MPMARKAIAYISNADDIYGSLSWLSDRVSKEVPALNLHGAAAIGCTFPLKLLLNRFQ
jgi:hypothetical protein